MFRRHSHPRCQRLLLHARCRRRISRQSQDDQQISWGPITRFLASYGHVRDLPSKDGLGRPRTRFRHEPGKSRPESKKHVKAIADALKDDPDLILATDPDREGEAISWHLKEALEKTPEGDQEGRDRPPRDLQRNHQGRRDTGHGRAARRGHGAGRGLPRPPRFWITWWGFTLSPVLWRKLPGAKSAGRVQSVALRIIVDREMEIEAFRPREYWSVRAVLETPPGPELRGAAGGHGRKEARPLRPRHRGRGGACGQGRVIPRARRHRGGGQARHAQPRAPRS